MRANFVRPAKILWVRNGNQRGRQDKISELGVWHEQNFLVDLGGDCVFALGGTCERASGHLQPAGLRNGHFRSDRPGSQVTAVDVETGESRETTTNEEGLYRFNLLPRRRYEVRA